MLQTRLSQSLGALLTLASLALFANSDPQGAGSLLAQQRDRAAPSGLTPEQAEILSHLSLVDLPDGNGGFNRTLRVTGVNVQIVNGLGATNGFPANPNSTDPAETRVNGLGNLILGYDELEQFRGRKSGSHNLVVGTYNTYLGFGGVVAGRFNRLEGTTGVVLGGGSNVARGESSTVVGGISNLAAGVGSLVAGGLEGQALHAQTTVMGGQYCRAIGFNSSTLGGFRNEATGMAATSTGGSFNMATGNLSTVSGGAGRTAAGENDWAAGSLLEDQ